MANVEFDRAHMDAGSMCNTMPHKHLLHHYEQFQCPSSVTLHVADKTGHHPVGRGWLRIPCRGGCGYRMVPAFHTPSLDAMIVSPNDKCGQHFGCRGYFSVSNFDGVGCYICLHHCLRSLQDVTFDLTLCCGLLFTELLIPPSTDMEHTSLMPHPVLHLREVSKDDLVSMSFLDDASTASTVCTGHPATSAAIPCSCPCPNEATSSCSCSLPSHPNPDDSFTDLPFDCSCCRVTNGTDDLVLSHIANAMLLFLHLGSQFDVSLDNLHQHALGIPKLSPDCPSVCGHHTSCNDLPTVPSPLASPNGTSTTPSDGIIFLDDSGWPFHHPMLPATIWKNVLLLNQCEIFCADNYDH